MRGDQSKMKRSTMKRKLKGLGVGLALAAMLTTAANASLTVYNWALDTDPSLTDNGADSSGTIELDSSLSLSEPVSINPGDPSSFSFILGGTTFDTFNGTILILSDGNLQLDGNATSTSSENLAVWIPDALTGPHENQVGSVGDPDYGDWVAVPEPSTIIASTLLLLPFGASTLRLLRKNRTA
jgi:hypothetical protein